MLDQDDDNLTPNRDMEALTSYPAKSINNARLEYYHPWMRYVEKNKLQVVYEQIEEQSNSRLEAIMHAVGGEARCTWILQGKREFPVCVLRQARPCGDSSSHPPHYSMMIERR